MACDVCQKNQVIGVAAVPYMPISVGYCQECLDAHAYPFKLLVANAWMMDGLDNASEDFKQMVADTMKHLGLTQADFDREYQMLEVMVA